jgi:hypothetical protein
MELSHMQPVFFYKSVFGIAVFVIALSLVQMLVLCG